MASKVSVFSNEFLNLTGRLKTGVSLDQASAERETDPAAAHAPPAYAHAHCPPADAHAVGDLIPVPQIAVLPVEGANYNTIASWISTGC